MLLTFRSFLTAVIFVGLSFISVQAQAQTALSNIAIVNFEQVLATSEAPKSIREQVQAKRDVYRKQIQQDEANLRQANQELAQKQALLSPEAFKDERRKFEQKVLEVQKKVQQKNLNLQKAQGEAQRKVKDILRKVVLNIAQKKGYALVLRRAQTVVVADQMDITKTVISELNQQLPTIKVFSGK